MPSANGVRYYDGSVAVITGAASGIGKALATALARKGGSLALVDMQEAELDEVADALRGGGTQVLSFAADVCDGDVIRTIVADTVAYFGRLDFIFNNAGIVIEGPAADQSLDDWNRIIDINLRGVVNGVLGALPVMRDQGFGHIVNTASLAGLIPFPRVAAYSATKHGVVGLTRAIRAEAAAHGVRATALCPGRVRTPILTGGRYGTISQEAQARISRESAGRAAAIEPEDFAERVLRALVRNKAIVVEPRIVRVVEAFCRTFPRTTDRLLARIARRMEATG